MSKLGYTWYPKDWKTNDKVFNLSLELRGLYREFIDFAYEKDNSFTVEHKYWCRMLDINKRKFDTLFARLLSDNLIQEDKGIYQIPSVEARIQLIRGGQLGGKRSKPTPSLPGRLPRSLIATKEKININIKVKVIYPLIKNLRSMLLRTLIH